MTTLSSKQAELGLRVALEVASLGGSQLDRLAMSLARSLPSVGIETLVICAEQAGEEAIRLRREGCRVEVLTSAQRAAELRALLLSEGIGLFGSFSSAVGIPVAAKLGIPVLAILHETSVSPGKGPVGPIPTVDCPVDHYLALSGAAAEAGKRGCGISPEQITVIANGAVPSGGEIPRRDAQSLVPGATSGDDEIAPAMASLFLRLAASSVARGVHARAELMCELEAARGDTTVVNELSELRSELHLRLERLDSEVRATRRNSDHSLQLAEHLLRLGHRILDKLRLLYRFRNFWSAALRGSRALFDASETKRHPAHGSAISPGPRGDRWLVIGVVPLDDIGGGQRSAQLARALAREGFEVSYTARFPRQESVDLALGRADASIEKLEWGSEALRDWLGARDERVRILVEIPDEETVDFALWARCRGARVIYDKVDNWGACTWAPWFRTDVEHRLATRADEVVASARILAEQLRALGREAELLANAVDRALFDPKGALKGPPADLVRGHVTLVYAGSLWGDWFDWNQICDVARRRPDWNLNLIGDPPTSLPFELPANVHLLGLKPQTDLPQYYASATACLIPFRRSPVVDAVSPLKLFEYLAMHRPVVASRMPELDGVPFVFFADSVDETIAAVEQTMTVEPPVPALEDYLQNHTWKSRVRSLCTLTARPTMTVIVLCYNNADVIAACVDSLDRARSPGEYEILVVDNGSTDGSIRILESRAAAGKIRLVRNPINGCSSGRNLGVRESASELVVFLDSDQTALGPRWVAPALRILSEDRRVGAVGWNAGWFRPGSGRGTIVDDLPARGLTGHHRGVGFRTDVAYLATSGFVLQRSVFARTHGFDENFDPTGFEDTDLSFQIKDLGYALAYCPELDLHHRPHGTTGALAEYPEVFARNERRFLEKWRHRPQFFFDVPSDV